jgi:hypothetical protein
VGNRRRAEPRLPLYEHDRRGGIRWSESAAAAAAAAAGSRKHRSDSAGCEEAGDGWSEGLEIGSGWLSGASFLVQDPEIGDEGGREQAGQG